MSTLINKEIDQSLNNIEFKPIDSHNTNIIEDEILNASKTGLINSMINSNLALIPKLIINDYYIGNKV